jgi:hypothetical protein
VFALAVVVGFIKPDIGYFVLLLLAFPSAVVRRALGRAGK